MTEITHFSCGMTIEAWFGRFERSSVFWGSLDRLANTPLEGGLVFIFPNS